MYTQYHWQTPLERGAHVGSDRQDTAIDPHRFYTEDEVAEILRCAPGTLRNKRGAGTGPRYFKEGGKRGAVLYPGVFLLEYINERLRDSTADLG